MYNEFTSFDRYFDHQNNLMDDLVFESYRSNTSISKVSRDPCDALMIAWVESMLELSGCIDSPAEHQWHCDPAYCSDWNEPQDIGSLLTVASIDIAGRLGRKYE